MSDKERAAQNVTVMGGFVNLLLTGLKGFIGVITNSAGLIADAIHSLTDLATDLFVWLAISFGKKEADENHPHGHKRFETIATLVVGIWYSLQEWESLLRWLTKYKLLNGQTQMSRFFHNHSIHIC